jgi:hypothetical protein
LETYSLYLHKLVQQTVKLPALGVQVRMSPQDCGYFTMLLDQRAIFAIPCFHLQYSPSTFQEENQATHLYCERGLIEEKRGKLARMCHFFQIREICY